MHRHSDIEDVRFFGTCPELGADTGTLNLKPAMLPLLGLVQGQHINFILFHINFNFVSLQVPS